ncbi:MAG TPA: hypothetical protein VLX31_17395 [Streptosporangiaceae bacterium]|nr:hypothetical protein [Streptosporangiaceae bacterium]
METIIGFAAGYLAGMQEGRDGLDRLRKSVRAIASSPEAHRLAAEAVALAGALVRQGSARGAKATASGVAELVVRRISETTGARRPVKH